MTVSEIVKLALSDSLFEPNSVSLESPSKCGCFCDLHGENAQCECVKGCEHEGVKSLAVRQKPEAKHFNARHLVEVPCWNDDEDLDSCSTYARGII